MIKNFFFKTMIYLKIIYSLFLFILDLIRLFFILLKRKDQKIFLMLEGGFGHTIVDPHFINLIEKSNWTLILAYDKKFHNKEIQYVFDKRIILISKTRIFWNFGEYIQNFLLKIFKAIYSIDIIPIKHYIMSQSCLIFKNNYHKTQESRTFKVFRKFKDHNLYRNYIKKYDDINLTSKFPKNKGIINFQFRAKAKETSTDDWFSHFRDSENIDYYKETIEYIFDNGWVILFGGENFDIPNWLKNYSNKFITRRDTNFDKDKYGMFVGLKSNIYIGPLSGASLFSMIDPKIKSLILNCLPFGFGHVNSVVSYPIFDFKSLEEFNHLFLNSLYEKNFDTFKNKIRKQSGKETKEIVADFLENINDDKYYLKQNLNIDNGLIQDAEFKISKKWLDIVKYDRLI